MLRPPELPRFDPSNPEIDAMSIETASVMDPIMSPTVNTSTMLPQTPPADLHVIDVSDTHSVPPTPVHPTRLRALYRLVPKSAPLTLTLPPPVLP
jgi:hypothetical protein